MLFNRRKMQGLEVFAKYGTLRPVDWAVQTRFYPIRSSYSYLLRLHRFRYLNRGRDWRGRIVYRLSPKGARWLLKYARGV